VILTIAAVVTNPLENLIPERLNWLDKALGLLNPRVRSIVKWLNTIDVLNSKQSPDLEGDLLPRIIGVIQSRLQSTYMKISETNASDPVLRTIALLNRRASDLKVSHGSALQSSG
jgi:hypothetical protein